MKNSILSTLIFFAVFILISGCEKEPEIPPTLSFKTGAVYTASDVTVSTDSTLTVGIIAEKTEDDLKLYNVSVAYDGAATTSTVEDFVIPESGITHYEKDVTFSVRSTDGMEKYYFTVTDVDGNIVQLSLDITVQ